MAISAEVGVSNWTIFDHPVRTEDFLDFLHDLRKTHGKISLTVFLDNLSAHRALADSQVLVDLDIRFIFNLSDSPEYNPIEMVFAEVKAHYRKQKLHALVNDVEFDMDDAIEDALNNVPIEHVKNYIEHCKRALMKKKV